MNAILIQRKPPGVLSIDEWRQRRAACGEFVLFQLKINSARVNIDQHAVAVAHESGGVGCALSQVSDR